MKLYLNKIEKIGLAFYHRFDPKGVKEYIRRILLRRANGQD